MPRRGEHSKEELTELILEATDKLVATNGVAGLNARAIAKAIGYAPGTIYLIFENLDAVILHLNGRTLDLIYQAIERATTGRAEPLERLKLARGNLAP